MSLSRMTLGMIVVVAFAAVTAQALADNRHTKKDAVMAAGSYLVDTLEKNLAKSLPESEPLLVASLVDVDDMGTSSTFGRLMAELLSARLTQKGYKIIEMKLRKKSVYIEEESGEFLLSRDVQEISRAQKAPVVLVGTYAEGFDAVYVNARLVRTDDGVVLSSAYCGIPMSQYEMKHYLTSK